MYQVLLGILDISISIVGALVIALIVPLKWRNRCLPWAFAYMLWWAAAGDVFVPMMNIHLYRLMFLSFFLAMGLILASFRFSFFRQNGAWCGFLLFIGYFMFAGCLGEGDASEIMGYYFRLLRLIVVGYLVGKWMVSRPDGGATFFQATTIAAGVTALFYLVKGSWNVAALADAGGRMVFDTADLINEAGGDAETISMVKGKFNVNRMALLFSMILPYPFLMIMCRFRVKHETPLRVFAIGSTLVLTLMLLRTGSRNGALAIFALVWFFLFAKTGLRVSQKWLVMAGMCLVAAFLVVRSFQGLEVRSFAFNEEQATSLVEVGNGRGAMLINLYESMTPTQHLFGSGVPWFREGEKNVYTGKRTLSNCHSIYTQIFVQSGYLGLSLLLIFYLTFYASAKRAGRRGNVGLLFFGVFALTGVGEAANIMGTGYATLGLGIGLALCGKARGQYDLFSVGATSFGGRRMIR